VIWEPLTRVYIYQKFNLTEGGQLVTDLYKAAANFTARTGAGLEIEHARHVYARFVKNNMEMKMALEHEEQEEKKVHTRLRSKRNIFGSIISSLTGLATGVCDPRRKNPQLMFFFSLFPDSNDTR
jgi:hypothetical protein